MTKFHVGIMLLGFGMVAGSGTTLLLERPSIALALPPTGGMNMKTGSRSAGDAEMNAAMSRMMQKTSATKLTGVQDRDFMMMMIPHHEAAVEMANTELRLGSNPQLKTLARNIIKSQNEEISQMKGWLNAWYRHGR